MTYRRFWPLALALLLLLPSSARAQTPTPATITQFEFHLLPATGDPLTVPSILTTTTSIGATQNCGLDPATLPAPVPTTSRPINPQLFVVDDPFTAGRKCRLAFPQMLPAGNYQWAGIFVAPSCQPDPTKPATSPCPSPRGVGQPPFSVVNPVSRPPAPTGFQTLPTP